MKETREPKPTAIPIAPSEPTVPTSKGGRDPNHLKGKGARGNRLKAAGITVPVIYMTGNDTPVLREAAMQSGCLAYLTKPFSASSLIEPLKQASVS